MADPRIVKDPKPIKTVSYQELRELSYMGASVLHEDAIYPARMADIPINIRNTNDAAHPGTTIVSQVKAEEGRIITGIAGSRGFTVITLYKNRMSAERGFVRKVLGILEDFEIGFEHLPSSIDTLSIVISQKELSDKLPVLLEEITRRMQPDHLEVSENIALIATVGAGMARRTGVSSRLFSALAGADINIRMIDQGSSEMNIIVGVSGDDFAKAVGAIYEEFEGKGYEEFEGKRVF